MEEHRSEKIRSCLERNREVLLHGDMQNGICYDGIVDETTFGQQPVKIAVLLKGTSGSDSSGDTSLSYKDWDYIGWVKHQQADGEPQTIITKTGEEKFLQDAFYSATYRKLCLWLCILQNLIKTHDGAYKQFFHNGKVDKDRVRSVLNEVAIINLKKSWGASSTDFNQLHAYAVSEDIQAILREEMDLVDPQIILCGSFDVFQIAREVFCNNSDPVHSIQSEKSRGSTFYWMYTRDDRLLLNFYHPACRGKKDLFYAELAEEIFSKVLEECKPFQEIRPEKGSV